MSDGFFSQGAGTPPAAAPATPAAPAATPPAAAPAPAASATLLADGTPAPADGAPKEGEGAPKVENTPFDAAKFTPPEGIVLSDTDKTELSGIATKHGLSNEAMTDLLSTYKSRLDAQSESAVKQFQDVNEGWAKEVMADPKIGGDKWPEVKQTIGKLLDNPQFADPGLKEALNYTGAGNNPAIVRSFYNMAKALTEGGHVGGQPAGAKPSTPQMGAAAMYPNLVKET